MRSGEINALPLRWRWRKVLGMIHVLLAENHSLIRYGIRGIFEATGRIAIVEEVRTGDDAVHRARALRPDVVVMDERVPGIGALEAIRRILVQQTSSIVCLVSGESPALTGRLLDMGVQGLIGAECSDRDVIQAVHSASRGRPFVAADIAQRLVEHSGLNGGVSPLDLLSRRELQVLVLVSQGDNPRCISRKLCLSPKTVSTYRHRICRKLGVRNDVELTHLALRHGLVIP